MQQQTTTESNHGRTAVDLIHAGAGTTLLGTYFALIPGVLPTLVLVGVIGAVLVLPLLVLGLAAAIVIAPFYAIRRLAGH